MSSGNSHGSPVNIETEYRRYEAARPAVREFMRNSFFDWKMPTLQQIGADPDAFIETMIRHDIAYSKSKASQWGDADGWIAAQGARKRRHWTDAGNRGRKARAS